MIKNNFRILKIQYAYLQTIRKAPVKFEKDWPKTVGGVAGRRYILPIRALEILKSESVQPMTMTSSMSPFPKKKNMYISPVTKTNDNWQSYYSF